MAGGIWTSQNKSRPGAYINFEATAQATTTENTKGIVALALPLTWGGEGKLIEVTSNDLLSGDSLAKIGMMSSDSNALLINLALQNAYSVKIYNTYTGGTSASKTLTGGLSITAKYPGTFGNKIAIVITATADAYIVDTYADGYFVDSQKVTTADELVANDFVSFSGTNVTLAATASTLLVGGTNGSTSGTAQADLFTLLYSTAFNTVAITSTSSTDITSAINFAKTMRNDEGKYIQVVVANADTTAANYEGVINVVNGVTLEDGTSITAAQFTAWVAGATAGASITESLTGKVVPNAVSISNMLSNANIIEALGVGKFVLSLNQNGKVKVEKDINSLHTFTSQKQYIFSKNRIIRELDDIGSNIRDIWETSYLGKVTNNELGRTQFRSAIINYLTSLLNEGAIEEFDVDQIIVQAGNDSDSVVAYLAVKPLDSMEFLYMTVNID